MKLGRIKIETLKLMFASPNDVLTERDLPIYTTSEQYKVYIAAMPGAINRCFADMESKRVIPVKNRYLSEEDGEVYGDAIQVRYNLKDIITDLGTLERVTCETVYGAYNGDCEYSREGDTIILPNIREEHRYNVLYRPKMEIVSTGTSDNTEIPLPDYLAIQIPYFVKGEIYRDDEPNEASEARNWYEAAMQQFIGEENMKGNHQGAVQSVYAQTEEW